MLTFAKGLLGAMATGILLVLALPPVGWWPLGWVALVPLFLACRGRRFFVGFALGLIAIAATAVVSGNGILYADKDISGEPTWISLGCAMFGTVIAIVAGGYGESKRREGWRLLSWAAIAVLLEAALMTTLPVTIALTQAGVTAMHFVASVVGAWGVSLLLWWSNLYLTEALATRRLHWGLPAAAAMLLVFGWIWARPGASTKTAKVVLVQSDEFDVRHLADLSGSDPTALAVWPEFGGLQGAAGGKTDKLLALSGRQGAPAFVTSFPDGGRPLPHNAAALFWRGQESARYAKRMLFGSERSMHTPGSQAVSVPWGETNVGLSICFDSCFPGVIREATADPTVGFVANPTTDPPSPHHWIAAMHAAFVPFRAAESGVPMVRDDSLAFSEVIDNAGNVLTRLPPGECTKTVEVPLQRRWTLYRLIGDAILPICGCLALAGFIPWGRKASSVS